MKKNRFLHFLLSFFLPNLIGGFIAVWIVMPATAATVTTKCVQCTGTCTKNTGCGSYCLPGYCNGGIEKEPIVPACNGSAEFSYEQNKCVCSTAILGAIQCRNVWEFWDSADNVCDCVQVGMCTNTTSKTPQPCCNSGTYPTGVNGKVAACASCPDNGLTSTSGDCTPASDVSKSNLSDGGLVGLDEYTGCYLKKGCSGTDEKGTFTLTDDCRHKLETVMIRPEL